MTDLWLREIKAKNIQYVRFNKHGVHHAPCTFLSLSSLGISATVVNPTLMRLSLSRLENDSVIPSIFPSLDRQLSRTSSLIWKEGQARGEVNGHGRPKTSWCSTPSGEPVTSFHFDDSNRKYFPSFQSHNSKKAHKTHLDTLFGDSRGGKSTHHAA